MEEQVQAQWVVRLPDRVIRLQRPLQAIRVFSTAEVLHFKTYYGAGDTKSRIERQHGSNSRQEGVTFEYWVVLFPAAVSADPSLDVLCCTVQRETADRILDSLWRSMFTNCGDNTCVDLRQLLAADLVTPDMVAATPAVGRFVDLSDGDLRRPVAAVGSVADAAVPVETISRGSVWHTTANRETVLIDRPIVGHMWTTADARLRVSGPPVAVSNLQQTAVPFAIGQAPVPEAVPESVRAAHADAPAVQTIGRGLARNADEAEQQRMLRLQAELHAAVQRQQPENRNTAPSVGSPGYNPEIGRYNHAGIWRTDPGHVSQRDGADTPAPTAADRDARRRANPMLGLDE